MAKKIKKQRLTSNELIAIKAQRDILIKAKVTAEMLEKGYEVALLRLQQKYDIPIGAVFDVDLKSGVITTRKAKLDKVKANSNVS